MASYRVNCLAAIIILTLIAQPALSDYVGEDNVPPTITFNSPTNGQNFNTHRVTFDVTLDGTGSPIREAFFNVLGDEVAYYGETDNSANCVIVPETVGSISCHFTYQITDGNAKVFSVLAYDYGIAYPGNMAEQGVIFSVNSRGGSSPPVVVPNITQIVNETNTTGNVTLNGTNSSSISNHTVGGGSGGGSSGGDSCSDGSRRCYGSNVQSCSGGTWSTVESCALGCDIKLKACVSDGLNVSANANESGQLNETKNGTSMSSQISDFLGEIYLPFYNVGKDNSWILWMFLLAIVLLLAVLLRKK